MTTLYAIINIGCIECRENTIFQALATEVPTGIPIICVGGSVVVEYGDGPVAFEIEVPS